MAETMFIADIAGEFDALKRMVGHAAPTTKIVCLGDLVDRGPKSRDVIEYLMERPEITVLKGNHEDMMVDFCRGTGVYQSGVWQINGGSSTLDSYGRGWNIPREHVDWLAALPYSYVTRDRKCFATHAPWYGPRVTSKRELERQLSRAPKVDPFGMLWNRNAPVRQPMFNVFGHNSHWGLEYMRGDGVAPHGLCLDQSRKRVLTGFLWTSRTVIQEPYQ